MRFEVLDTKQHSLLSLDSCLNLHLLQYNVEDVHLTGENHVTREWIVRGSISGNRLLAWGIQHRAGGGSVSCAESSKDDSAACHEGSCGGETKVTGGIWSHRSSGHTYSMDQQPDYCMEGGQEAVAGLFGSEGFEQSYLPKPFWDACVG